MPRPKSILVVGAGLAGATYARVLAEHGVHVEVIDRRPHVAGNAFDEVDGTGVRRHVYGPHLFHTNSTRVMTWLERFAEFVPYDHRVTARIPARTGAGARFVPLPVNRATVNAVLGLALADADAVRDHLARIAVPHRSPANAAEYLHSRVGVELTDLLFRPYTRTMWGADLEAVHASVVRRVPVRHDDEDRYFPTDRHQGLPRHGYADLVLRILDHPGVRVTTGVAFRRELLADHEFCFTSASMDEWFGYALGPLPYRSIRFHHRVEPAARDLGPTAQVNFTDGSAFTRQSDWSLLPGHRVRATGLKTVTVEEPCAFEENGFERYYPVPDADGLNAALHARYRALAASERNVRFIGRCGAYRYLDMDQVIAQSMKGAHDWLAGVATAVDEERVR